MDDTRIQGLYDLIKAGKLKKLKKGEPFPTSQQSPKVSIITSGYIKRFRVDSNEGQSVQLIYGPGDIFPLTPIFKSLLNQDIYEGPETYYYGAMSDASYYSLDIKQFISGIKKNPEFYKELLHVCGKRIQTSIERLENLSLQNSYRRTAHYLARLARQSGEEMPKGILIRLPITQKDLAENLGLKQSTVARALRRLREEGLITGRGQIIVLKLDTLEDRAYD